MVTSAISSYSGIAVLLPASALPELREAVLPNPQQRAFYHAACALVFVFRWSFCCRPRRHARRDGYAFHAILPEPPPVAVLIPPCFSVAIVDNFSSRWKPSSTFNIEDPAHISSGSFLTLDQNRKIPVELLELTGARSVLFPAPIGPTRKILRFSAIFSVLRLFPEATMVNPLHRHPCSRT